MKNFTIIPAMDLIEGQCVRLTEGDFDRKKNYSSDPVAVAQQLEHAGFRRLHMVDLDGAKNGRPAHLEVLNKVAAKTSLIIDYSGGVKMEDDLERVLENGAAIVAVGSLAVKNKYLFFNWLEKYGPDKILLGVDVRDEKLAISGWQEQTEIDLFEFLTEMTAAGVKQVFCTDIKKDGQMAGPATTLYGQLKKQFPSLKLTASGGVRNVQDIEELKLVGCCGAIVGKAIYENPAGWSSWLENLK